jgi:tetratricopeptide (TPR) repeat protein
MKLCGRYCLLLILLGPTIRAAASSTANQPPQAQTIPGLGTATFPTSTHSPEAQTAFMHGLLLLHVFEYPSAAKAFQTAETIDPTFVMAYWGEAMTQNHPVWNEIDVPAGQAALNKLAPTPEARAALVADPRQRAFLAAVEILYNGNGNKPERDALYATAMQHLAQSYPADDEAQLFYSLALLGRSEGVRDVPAYLQAAAIAKAVYKRNPNHPGAAHYWIHGMDDPDHAAGALVAANALSKIAPDAGHAQHMCSHIFMALGMWDAVVEANINAVHVVDEQTRAKGLPILTCGHYVLWLQYGYEQQGRQKDADQLLTACETTSKDNLAWMDAHPGSAASSANERQRLIRNGIMIMRGTSVIESRQWDGPAVAMAVDTASFGPEAGWNLFTTGYAAAQRGDLPLAQDSLKDLRLASQAAHSDFKANKETASYLDILADELDGLISSKSRDMPDAIAKVQRAVTTYDSMAFDFGPPRTLKPPQELLGELFLEDGKPDQARKAFQTSLKRAPNRTESLLGLARAQNAADDKAGAMITYKELLAIWKNADVGNQDVAEARHYTTGEAEKQASTR